MLLFCDSFDHYATADLLTKWTSGGSNMSIGSGRGQYGGNTLLGSAGNNGAWSIQWVNPAGNLQTWIIGAACRGAFSNPSVLTWRVFMLYDGASCQLSVRRNMTTGFLELWRGDGTTLLATGTTPILDSVYYFIELKAKIDNTTGTATVRVNGVTDITYSGDTAATANNSADRFQVSGSTGISSNLTVDYDNIMIADTTGSILNDLVGEVRVIALFPNGDGATSNMVGSDGNSVNNSLLVDETAPNGDTDYVESSNPGDKDTYAFGNLSQAAGTVYGVQVLYSAKKTDAGTRSMASIARLSGTEVDGPTTALTSAYTYYRDVRESKPGGGQWTIADVNSAEFGVKVVA